MAKRKRKGKKRAPDNDRIITFAATKRGVDTESVIKTLETKEFPGHPDLTFRQKYGFLGATCRALGDPGAAMEDYVASAYMSWRRNGRHTIIIPDRETFDLLEKVDISKVVTGSLKVPYRAVDIGMPKSLVESEFDGAVIRFCETSPKEILDEDQLPILIHGAEISDRVAFYAMALIDDRDNTAVTNNVILGDELCSERLRKEDENPLARQTTDPEVRRMKKVSDRLLALAMKLFICLEAHPEMLVDEMELFMRRYIPDGKGKRRHGVTRTPGLKIGFKKEMTVRGTHWRSGHPRSLVSERYCREDPETGELLEAGQPGKIRVVWVKGGMVRGRTHYVDRGRQQVDAE